MKEKIIACFLAALMALVTGISPVLAATTLGDYPTFLGTVTDGVGSLDAYVVIGKDAASEDVVGAIDLVLRLGELSYEETAIEGVTTAAGVFSRDGITICTNSTSTKCQLIDPESSNVQAFPSAQIKTAQWSGLKDSTISWKSNDYDYREQVDISGVVMSHDYATTNVNGTMKMIVESGDVIYEYVFEKNLNLSSASAKGTLTSPEYTYPINIKLLGKDFTIVGIGSSSIKALSGAVGTATATIPVVYGDYSVYATQGGTTFVQVAVKDKNANTVCTLLLSGWSSGSEVTKTCDAANADVTVTSIAALEDGTVVGADLVVGDIGKTTKTYDTSADVTSTGTANDKWSSTYSDWGIQVSGFATSGQASNGDKVQVVYKPTDTKYLKAGEKVTLPDEYAYLTYEGFNTEKFATITITPVTSLTAYNYSSDTQAFGNLNGFKILSDVTGSIVAKGNYYDSAYILFNRTWGTGNGEKAPIMIGYYDNAKQKILINGTFETSTAVDGGELIRLDPDANDYERGSIYVNKSGGAIVNFGFKISYAGSGEQSFYLNFLLQPNTTKIITNAVAGYIGKQTVNITNFQNKTVWSETQTPEFRLGATAASAEDTDVNARTNGASSDQTVGKASQDIVDDSGIIIVTPGSNSGADKVQLKVPEKRLANKVSFGKATGTTTTGTTVKAIKSITTPVAVLDTEVTSTHKAKNLVAVGGPAVNRVSADAMELTYPTYGSSGLLPFSEGEAYIAVYDSVTGYTGKVVVVAGWEAAQTRTACTVLQQYDTLLVGQTASAVKVTSATTSGITAVTTTTTTTAATTTTTAAT